MILAVCGAPSPLAAWGGAMRRGVGVAPAGRRPPPTQRQMHLAAGVAGVVLTRKEDVRHLELDIHIGGPAGSRRLEHRQPLRLGPVVLAAAAGRAGGARHTG